MAIPGSVHSMIERLPSLQPAPIAQAQLMATNIAVHFILLSDVRMSDASQSLRLIMVVGDVSVYLFIDVVGTLMDSNNCVGTERLVICHQFHVVQPSHHIVPSCAPCGQEM